MANSPTSRTTKLLRDQGYAVAIVERRVPFRPVTQDAFGFADLIAMHPAHTGTLYVQATSGANHAARRHKLNAISAVQLAIQTGNRVQIISWSKSRKTKRWTPRIEAVEVQG